MTFAYPHIFLLAALIPGLVYLRHSRKRLPAVRFSDGKLLNRLPVSWSVYVNRMIPVFYALGIFLLIAAAARPQEIHREYPLDIEGVDIVMLIDISSSMKIEDFVWEGERMNRLDAVTMLAGEFIRSRENDRVSLIAFAGVPYTLTPLSIDQDWVARRMDRIDFHMVTDGTAIGSAIASGVNRLRDSDAESRVIILLTDGVNNAGNISPENAAKLAAALDIRVHTIGIGTQDWAPMPVTGPFGNTRYVQQRAVFDEAQLRHIAEITGSRYFHASDMASMEMIYEEIDDMTRTEFEVEYFTRTEERFMMFLIPALSLFILERLLSMSRFGRLP